MGAVLWIGLIRLLRGAAKIDPQMSKVYIRPLRFKRFYPAFSRPWRVGQGTTRY